jgi:hypothetical protein
VETVVDEDYLENDEQFLAMQEQACRDWNENLWLEAPNDVDDEGYDYDDGPLPNDFYYSQDGDQYG